MEHESGNDYFSRLTINRVIKVNKKPSWTCSKYDRGQLVRISFLHTTSFGRRIADLAVAISVIKKCPSAVRQFMRKEPIKKTVARGQTYN